MIEHQNDQASALLIQKYQLNQAENKISEINDALTILHNDQANNNAMLDQMLFEMENLNLPNNDMKQLEQYEENLSDLINELPQSEFEQTLNIPLISELDSIKIESNISWTEYIKSIEDYAFKNNINLKSDPFDRLMTQTQKIELEKRIQEDFTLKNANCDKYDYMIAGTCGVIAGLIDILFVGIPTDSKLGTMVDGQANKITEKFAEFLGWNKEKAVEKGSNTTASAIGFLEDGKGNFQLNKDSWLYKILQSFGFINEEGKFKGFKINYDQARSNGKNGTGGLVENLLPKNHHLKSLGHSPDIIGLIFSIFNQFTSTSSFINEGKIITIDTDTFELNGGNFVAKIFCGFANWFGHLISDWTGASGTVGKGGRGTGIPIPFYNLFQMINIGEFGKDRQTFAKITTLVFEKGYDFRHGATMAIPVLINELLIRFMHTMKAHFYHNKEWNDSIPNGSIPELRRMLLVGHGTLCLMDGTDAAIRSGGEIVTFLLRTNLIAWTRFGQLSLKEVYAWHKSGHLDNELVDKYLDEELKKLIR